MTQANDQPQPASATPVEQELGLAAGARWYCLSRDGLATLCHDEEDAHEVAAESWVLYPQNGPYRVAQMVDARAVAEAVAAERERWEEALRKTWRMVDPLKPAGTPGSYARGQDSGIVAALETLRRNLGPNFNSTAHPAA